MVSYILRLLWVFGELGGVFLSRKDRMTSCGLCGYQGKMEGMRKGNTLRPSFLCPIHTSFGSLGCLAVRHVRCLKYLPSFLLHLHWLVTPLPRFHYIILPIPIYSRSSTPDLRERENNRIQYTYYNKRKGADHIPFP